MLVYTCDICTSERLRWPPKLPVCNCKTLSRCPECHFKQLAAPGKQGVCDVCKTERCEVGVLSVLPFTSQLYPWAQALHTDAVTSERCPTLLFQCSPRGFDFVTIVSAFFAGVAIGCVVSMPLTPDDKLFSVQYCLMLAFLAVQSVVDSLSLAGYAAPGQDRTGTRRLWLACQVLLWSIFVTAVTVMEGSTPHSRALLAVLFLASRFPGWCIDFALVVRMRQYLASQLKQDNEPGSSGAVSP